MGLLFITVGKFPSMWLSDDPAVRELTARCLFITGFIQSGFAAAAIFGGALRGAGDTLAVMLLNLASVIILRLLGVMFVAHVLHRGLAAIWVVLAAELFFRGVLMYSRFLHGG